MSANLLANFAPAEKKNPAQFDEDSTRRRSEDLPISAPGHKLPAASKKTARIPRIAESVDLKENIETILPKAVSDLRPDGDSAWTETRPFSEFSTRWTSFMRPAQLAVCRAIWEMTYAIGQSECFSSMTRLAAAANLSERQCYRSVDQLERRGFVERIETFNTAKTKGTIFILHAQPIQSHLKRKRIYHIGE